MIDINKPLAKCNTAELEAELDLYRSTEGVEVPDAKSPELSSNKKRVEVLEKLREEHGYPYDIAKGDNEKLAHFAESKGEEHEPVEEGERVFLTREELDVVLAVADDSNVPVPGSACTLEDGTEGIVAPDGICVPRATPEEEAEGRKAVGMEKKDSVTASHTVKGEGELVFNKKTVTSVNDRIINGRLYKEVLVGGETYTLSPEEFDEQVRVRKES